MSFPIKDGFTVDATLDASAIAQIDSTAKGTLLVPRMTKVERLAIASPATGLNVYQTDDVVGIYTYDGTNWISGGIRYLDGDGGFSNKFAQYNDGQTAFVSGVIASNIFSANTFYFFPTMLQGSISEFAINITNLASQVVYGVYDSNENGLPNNLIWQSAEYATLGIKSSTGLSLNLPRGRYWIAVLSNGSTVRFTSNQSIRNILGMSSTFTHLNRGEVAGVYAYTNTLPAVAPSIVLQSSAFSAPILFFKK